MDSLFKFSSKPVMYVCGYVVLLIPTYFLTYLGSKLEAVVS